MSYGVRAATLGDLDVLVRHRIGMFTDMGVSFEPADLEKAFEAWLQRMMPNGTYRAWLVEDGNGGAVAGGGISILPWPPGPRYPGDRMAFVYNVYVERGHRRRGLGRLVMDAIHDYCREAGIQSIALNASQDGRPLYEALGYQVTSAPMMIRLTSDDGGHLV